MGPPVGMVGGAGPRAGRTDAEAHDFVTAGQSRVRLTAKGKGIRLPSRLVRLSHTIIRPCVKNLRSFESLTAPECIMPTRER